MPVQYNMDPFSVLKIIYGDTTDGFEREEFETNENERGIVPPFLLKDFLFKYAYLPVNRQSKSVKFFHPNLMNVMRFSAENIGELNLLCVGRVGEYQIAVKNEQSEDPRVFLVYLSTQSDTQVLPSDDIISELIKVMLCNLLLTMKDATIAETPEDAVRLLRENGVNLDEIRCDPTLSREYSINYSEETQTFAVAEFVKGEFFRFFFVKSKDFK
ncbi:MAG: hypothetical protein J1F04_00730 [Oscillospiraceae bacterium]|nr:hypothetical protein [Oscillospiraceae bacterium]